MAPATPGPDPDFDFVGAFPKVAKRFWPLRPPIGLRFDSFAITRRGLTVPGDGFGLKGPMARNSNPAFFPDFLDPLPGPILYAYYPPVWLAYYTLYCASLKDALDEAMSQNGRITSFGCAVWTFPTLGSCKGLCHSNGIPREMLYHKLYKCQGHLFEYALERLWG